MPDNKLINRLEKLGFKHEQFPDGWFWHLSPQSDEAKMRLAKILGIAEDFWDGPPDCILVQVAADLKTWSYYSDVNFGMLTEQDAMEVLDKLERGETP